MSPFKDGFSISGGESEEGNEAGSVPSFPVCTYKLENTHWIAHGSAQAMPSWGVGQC